MILSFLPLINTSVIFGLSFLLISISATIALKNIVPFLFGFYSSVVL